MAEWIRSSCESGEFCNKSRDQEESSRPLHLSQKKLTEHKMFCRIKRDNCILKLLCWICCSSVISPFQSLVWTRISYSSSQSGCVFISARRIIQIVGLHVYSLDCVNEVTGLILWLHVKYPWGRHWNKSCTSASDISLCEIISSESSLDCRDHQPLGHKWILVPLGIEPRTFCV